MSCSLCGDVCRCVPGARPAEDSGLETGVPERMPEVANLSSATAQESLLPGQDGLSWRKEVSERLNRYHARRRPRPPRYPSLRLKFEQPETRWAGRDPVAQSPSAQATSQPSPVMRQAVAVNYVEPTPETASPPETWATEVVPIVPERRRNDSTGKLIEFPRTIYTPVVRADDLAETILDRPRILEAPEIVPPPPALGGMTIEEVAKPEPERRPGIDMPLQSASIGQRLLAGSIDGTLVLAAGAVFGAIFYKVVNLAPTPAQTATWGSSLVVLGWGAYQYLLMVYSGSTPGLRLLHLQLQRFDGIPANRKTRRARVLCAMLSAISLGLGYGWHFLDEDGLFWHERVTRTHIAPRAKPQ